MRTKEEEEDKNSIMKFLGFEQNPENEDYYSAPGAKYYSHRNHIHFDDNYRMYALNVIIRRGYTFEIETLDESYVIAVLYKGSKRISSTSLSIYEATYGVILNLSKSIHELN